ncbi:hypothetical protein [Blastococcus deserti]|uniref:Uncharacterized protein n=1 Tax=Blastococcus deserti TaxID=2259033 RepID=A0ABW4XFM9_9ACTN
MTTSSHDAAASTGTARIHQEPRTASRRSRQACAAHQIHSGTSTWRGTPGPETAWT